MLWSLPTASIRHCNATSSSPRRPVFSGVVAYRGVMPAARVPGWGWPNALVNWVGQGKHFLVFPVRAGALLNYVGFVPADEQMRESWSAPGDPAVLAAEFADWDPWLSRLLSQIDATFRWGLYDRDPLPRWTHGRLALLGDAAHAMLPHMGQGANQSIEDGMALATLMRDTDRRRRGRCADPLSGAAPRPHRPSPTRIAGQRDTNGLRTGDHYRSTRRTGLRRGGRGPGHAVTTTDGQERHVLVSWT